MDNQRKSDSGIVASLSPDDETFPVFLVIYATWETFSHQYLYRQGRKREERKKKNTFPGINRLYTA